MNTQRKQDFLRAYVKQHHATFEARARELRRILLATPQEIEFMYEAVTAQ